MHVLSFRSSVFLVQMKQGQENDVIHGILTVILANLSPWSRDETSFYSIVK